MMDRIQIGPDRLEFIRDGDAPKGLALGTQTISQAHFRSTPPTAAELEAAIDTIETALMPVSPDLGGEGPLLTDDPESRALAEFAGFAPGSAAVLDIADVERQFNRLVNVAHGRPASSEGLPLRASFAANLLILRELMHHAGRRSLWVIANETSSGDLAVGVQFGREVGDSPR